MEAWGRATACLAAGAAPTWAAETGMAATTQVRVHVAVCVGVHLHAVLFGCECAALTVIIAAAVSASAEGDFDGDGVRVGAIVGTCEEMCPAPERAKRAGLNDIQVCTRVVYALGGALSPRGRRLGLGLLACLRSQGCCCCRLNVSGLCAAAAVDL